VKISPVKRIGRRNRLPHHCKHEICSGGAGGSACDARHFFTAAGPTKKAGRLGAARLMVCRLVSLYLTNTEMLTLTV
jgi:hypothetical protein